MPKPVVAIAKPGQWKWAFLNKNHPEYSAIFNVIEQHSAKFDFVLIGTSGKAPLYRSVMKKGIVAWDVPDNGIFGNLTYLFQLIRIFAQSRPKLIIILGNSALLPALLFSFFSFRARTKCVPIFIAGFGYYGKKKLGRLLNFAQQNLTALALRTSAFAMPYIFALSIWIRDTFTQLASNLKGKISLISYPISPIFSPSKNLDPENDATPNILTVAAIDPRKGLDVLIKALSLIPIKIRPNLIINGPTRDSQYKEHLTRMVRNLGLSSWIKFSSGFNYNDLPSLYRSAILFVLPTREDVSPVVVLEALHCGLPVIGTSVGGIPDMIVNGKNGILVKPDDPKELANAILLLLRNKELRLFLARNSFITLNSNYYNRLSLKQAFEESLSSVEEAN